MLVIRISTLIACAIGFIFTACSSAKQPADTRIPLKFCGALLRALPLSRGNLVRTKRDAVCIASQRYGTMLLLSNPWPETTLKVLAPRATGLSDEFFDISKDRLIASHAVKDSRFSHTRKLVAASVESILIMYSAMPPQPYDNRVFERRVLYTSTGGSTRNLYYNPQEQLLHAGPPP